MPPERVDEAGLVKYLLGNLSEAEQEQVEDRAFADVDYMSAIEASEADLIDMYVRGGLSQSERRAFERRFLTSPNRRSKVEFARTLARVASESPETEGRAPRKTFISVLRAWSPPLRMAVAFATLFCVAGMSWLLFQSVAMHSRIGVLESERRESENREEALRRQLAEEKGRVTAPGTEQKQQQPTASPLIASLILLPGLSRSTAQAEQLTLPPTTQIAHVDIHVESRDDYPRFRAELRTRRGEDVLTRGNLVRRRVSGGYAVSFDVPASALAAGEYELTLKGVANGQASADIGYYYFSVRK
jgi:hypothetical protein